MELLPAPRLAWANGWILLAVFYSVFGFLLWRFPRDVVRRLYDKSGWSREEHMLINAGKVFALIAFGLVFLAPLKFGEGVFALGTALFALGLGGFVIALRDFARTPLDCPVTGGLYNVSRNPQVAALSVAGLGMCIAIGSWAAVVAWMLSHLSSPLRILAEEKSCLRQYGDAYRSYMRRVPRYFLFF